ncbi:hypothetical protein MRB53_014967 [Persea americana]|uniref:Uncharacterized protein n=1 Tax=Persea americana TaxID=3435 RepID=A0ACC2KCH8_PERAE|nr:hypothetical protein MRB53_014967 [Persea americana]
MAVDDSFKRPGAVPFKWEIQPGVPKAQPPPPRHNPMSQKTPPPKLSPPKLSPPPSGISFYPPHHSTLLVRIPSSHSKSSERHRRPGSRPNSTRNSMAVAVDTGCFPVASPRRKIERKTTYRSENMKLLDDDIHETHDLQTLARWSVSSRKSFSPFNSSSPSTSPFCTPRRVEQEDAEWAAYGLF